MSTIPPEKIERTRNTPRRRRSTGNRRPLWFRAALVTNVGVPIRLGAIAAVILSVGAAFAGLGAPSRHPSCISGPRFATAWSGATACSEAWQRGSMGRSEL
jgi:hypothetical protein